MNSLGFLFSLIMLALLPLASAGVIVDAVETSVLTPGTEGAMRVTIENTLDEDIEDVSLQLNYQNLPLTSVGSSEKSAAELDEDEQKTLVFRMRAASDAEPGDYEISYILTYSSSDGLKSRPGSVGLRITGEPNLEYSISIDNPVENQQGKISLKLVNTGFADARFVSVTVTSGDFMLLSEERVYVGAVDSDDFETAEFDALFDKNPAEFRAAVEYKDFNNNEQSETVNLPLTIYSREEALRLGIISRSSWTFILPAAIFLLAGLIVWRTVKKRKRLQRSMRKEE